MTKGDNRQLYHLLDYHKETNPVKCWVHKQSILEHQTTIRYLKQCGVIMLHSSQWMLQNGNTHHTF